MHISFYSSTPKNEIVSEDCNNKCKLLFSFPYLAYWQGNIQYIVIAIKQGKYFFLSNTFSDMKF